MHAMQDPVTSTVAKALGMTAEQCDSSPALAARRAGALLRANGYERRYYTMAWERGMRWFYAGSSVPEPALCATTTLGVAIAQGRIKAR